MCGIYGITTKDENFIHQFIKICKHRGPDGEGVWSNNNITLGHNLLAITDSPTHSKQPWITPRGNVLIYNGEIFNYYELLEKYKNFIPTTTCDTELLAWGLDTYGIAFLEHIDSMHGLAYYEKDKNKLTISRDHAGIKPLYYAEINEGLVFGSEIKGMLEKVNETKEVDDMALFCLSYTGINLTKNTLFKGIKKLLSGETLEYNLTTKSFSIQRNIIQPSSTKKFNKEEFCNEMNIAVKMCSIGQSTIGILLSGGLDSSIIAHELSKIKSSISTFTTSGPDAKMASKFATKYNFNHREISIESKTFNDYWGDAIYSIEQPEYTMSLPMVYHTYKTLSDNGIVISLAGDMGDEMLCGYIEYFDTRNKLKKRTTQRQLIDYWLNYRHSFVNLFTVDSKYNKNDLLDELIGNTFPETIFNPDDIVSSHMMIDTYGQASEMFFPRTDKFAMAHGIESRFPMATKRFMTYCMSINSKYKIGFPFSSNSEKNNITKMIARISYKDILSDEIINMKKLGWAYPDEKDFDFINTWATKYNMKIREK